MGTLASMLYRSVIPSLACFGLLLGVVAGLLGGCGLDLGGAPSSKNKSESILTLFGPPSPKVAASWAVDPYDADKRYRGTLMLANAPFGGEPVYIELYEKAITDGDARVRSAATRALALHGGPEHVPLILPMLHDDDRLMRWEAARALQRLYNAVAVSDLLRSIEPSEGVGDDSGEPEPMVRAAAATALGQYAQPRVLDGLIAALSDPDLAINRAALGSLRTLTGQDFGYSIRAWVHWKSSTKDLFAGRTPFVYPVFHRDPHWYEWAVPFLSPPNEVASTPAGMPDPFAPAPQETTVASDGSTRNN